MIHPPGAAVGRLGVCYSSSETRDYKLIVCGGDVIGAGHRRVSAETSRGRIIRRIREPESARIYTISVSGSENERNFRSLPPRISPYWGLCLYVWVIALLFHFRKFNVKSITAGTAHCCWARAERKHQLFLRRMHATVGTGLKCICCRGT